MSKKTYYDTVPLKIKTRAGHQKRNPKSNYLLSCVHMCTYPLGVKVLDVEVEVVLYMCDSGASFLSEHKTPIGSLHKPSTS
jgi:hypothetical protein